LGRATDYRIRTTWPPEKVGPGICGCQDTEGREEWNGEEYRNLGLWNSPVWCYNDGYMSF
jgi:hypothetical protein